MLWCRRTSILPYYFFIQVKLARAWVWIPSCIYNLFAILFSCFSFPCTVRVFCLLCKGRKFGVVLGTKKWIKIKNHEIDMLSSRMAEKRMHVAGTTLWQSCRCSAPVKDRDCEFLLYFWKFLWSAHTVNNGQLGLLVFRFGHDAGADPRGSKWRSSGSVLSARLLRQAKFGRL